MAINKWNNTKWYKISQRTYGSTWNYSKLSNNTITISFATYKTPTPIMGINANYFLDDTKFRAGSKFVRFAIIFNRTNTPDTSTSMKNFYIRKVNE